MGPFNAALGLGRTRLPCGLNLLADVVSRSLIDLSTDAPWEAALGRLTAAFRPGRTRFPCVPPAAGTLVLLAVELSCVAMVIPGPSRLTV